jgi:hypothetical protein
MRNGYRQQCPICLSKFPRRLVRLPTRSQPFLDRLMFWTIDDELYNVDNIVKEAQDLRTRAIDRNRPEYDIKLLNDALMHA